MSQKTDDQAKPPLNLLSPDKFNRAIFLLGELNKLMVPAMNEMHGLASDLQTAAMQKMAEYATAFRMGEIDESALEAFYRRPFPRLEQARSPGGRVIPGTYSLKIPRFLPMQVGFLESQDDSYNYFRVNRYLDWFGEIPDYIKKELDWKEAPDLKVQGEELVGPRDALIAAVQAHPGLLKEKDGKVLVNKDRYYELLVALIKEGVKPFAEEPVDPADIVERKCDYALRPYQTEIHNLFLKNRHMGIFIPPSTGKTVLGTYEASHLKPPHLFIVPTVMLKEQWEDRIEQHTDLKLGDEVIVEYYTTAIKKYANGFPVKDDKGKVTGHIPFTLKVIDEVHHIGASYYIRMFGIPSKYSLGLSATPYREDSEGEELVFALTGMPVGLSWQYFRDLNLIRNPVCNVWIEKDEKTKERRAIELVTASQKKTIIFCDYIEPGRILAKKLNVPHVYGATKDNLATITAAPVSVVSRVGDEGVSLPDLERIIEYSWNFGSRRQELQRFGRLLHSQMLKQEHHVLMTLNEYAHDKKRFLSIMDKGFKIEIHKEGISDKVIEAKMRRETPRAPRTFSGGPTRQATIAETVPAPEIPSAVTQRLPGITKTLERLETVERVVATTILGNPANVYSTKELGLATGYSPVTLVHKAHFGKLIDLGLIKEEKGKYRSAL